MKTLLAAVITGWVGLALFAYCAAGVGPLQATLALIGR